MPARSRAKFLQEQIAVSYYQWEFLRRNSAYRKDYRTFDKQFGPWLKRHGRPPNMKDPAYDAAAKHYFERIYPEESRLREKWGVYPPVDPGFHCGLAALKQNPLLWYRMPFPPEQRVWVFGVTASDPFSGTLELSISLKGPKPEIMEQLEFILDHALAERKRRIGSSPKMLRKRLDHYGEYLQVWDLHQEGKTPREIAELLNPDELRHWDTHPRRGRRNPANPIVQRVRDHCREACRLIGGGYKEIR